MHTPRLLTRLVLTAALAAAAGVSSVRAANYYWDIDGPSLTNTMDAPSGTWDGVTNVWNSFLQGSNGNFLAVLGETNTAVFSASPFATNAYTVTVTGTQITEAVFVEDGILTLDGGAIQFAASSSSTDTKSYIRTTTGTRGTVMVNSEIRVLNTNATTSLLKLIAGAGSGAVDLSINGPISVVVPANKFFLRPGGAGVGRITSNIGTNLTSIQADTGQRMEAIWTVAGTQTLGTASVILPIASTATVGVNGKLVMGDSTNDVQAWGSTIHNNTNGTIVINSTATLGGNIDIGAGTNVTINGHARFSSIANVVQWPWTNAVYTNRFTVSDAGSITFKIGTTTIGNYGRFAKSNNTFTNVVLALNGGLGFDLTSAAITNGNVWQIIPITNTVAVSYGTNFSVVGFTPDLTSNTWTYVDASTNTWTFQKSSGTLSLEAPQPAIWVGNIFWDINGTNSGAGGAGSPTGNWNGVDTNFNINSAGGSSAGYLYSVTTTNADVIFSAGSDATNAYTVTVTGTQSVRTLRFQEGTPTLSGGVLEIPRSVGSFPTAGYIGNSSDTNLAGTVTIDSGLQLNTAPGVGPGNTSLLKLLAQNGPPALDLLVSGPISVTATNNGYGLRLFGKGNGRIATSLTSGSATLLDIQSVGGASENLGGTWTIAGNQPLGTNTLVYLPEGCATAGAQVVFGDSTNDVQSFGLGGVDDTDLTLVINSWLTANRIAAGDAAAAPNTTSGGAVILNGSLGFGGTDGTVRVGPLASFTLQTNAVLRVTVGTASGTDHNRVLPGTNSVSGGTVTLDGSFVFDLSGAPTSGSNNWLVVDNANLTETYGASFAVAGFSNVAAGVWKYQTGSQEWTFQTSSGVLTLVGGTAYDQWATSKGLDNSPGKESGFSVDPENDTMANGLEWVLGGEPLTRDSASIRPVESIVGSNFEFSFDRVDESEAETTLVVQWGSTLTAWNDVTIWATNSVPDVNGVTVTVTENGASADGVLVRVPTSNGTNGTLFLRLKATQN